MSAPFSPRRKFHQAQPAEVTGELPTAALLCGYLRRDGSSTGHASQELLGFTGLAFGWSGCLDAPDYLPTGGCRPVYATVVFNSKNFDAIAARSQHREVMFKAVENA